MKPFQLYYDDKWVSEHTSLDAARIAGKKIVSSVEQRHIKVLRWSFIKGEWLAYWRITGFTQFGGARLRIKKSTP